MTAPFDPYHKWLGISPKDQPPDHYRLLGIDRFESDLEVVGQRTVHESVSEIAFRAPSLTPPAPAPRSLFRRGSLLHDCRTMRRQLVLDRSHHGGVKTLALGSRKSVYPPM